MRRCRGPVVAALVLLALVLLPGAATASVTAPAPLPGSAAPDAGTSTASVGTPPLVVLMDLSGSMDQGDGAGTVKLDGAKRALLDVVGQQPPEASVGLWTYPGGSGECAPGDYLEGQQPRPLVDPGRLTASIRTLTAGGGTPTGPALQAVAASLEDEQVGRATVLLVSDGESNCGEDPCQVAKDVVAQGLDVTVQAVGFKISPAGRDELRCIASATDGTYSDVSDSAALAARLTAASASPLRLTAEPSATTIAAGAALTVTAAVGNPSATRTDDVSLSLVVSGEGDEPLFLAVVPPLVRLGNIPPGRTVTYRWTLSTSGAREGVASYRVVASAPAAGSVRRTGAVTVTDQHLGVDQAGPVLRDALDHGPVAVVGDSYSSGEGAGDYTDLGSKKRNLCHRSPRTYGAQLFGPSSTKIIACSGAVAANVTAPNDGRDVASQVEQLEKLDRPPGLVLLSLGGNDAGFGDIIAGCFFSSDGRQGPLKVGPLPLYFRPSECTGDTAFTTRYSQQLVGIDENTRRAVAAVDATVNRPVDVERRRGWRAPIVVMAYPQILPAALRSNCLIRVDQLELTAAVRQYVEQDWSRQVGFSTSEVVWLNGVGQQLNDAVHRGVTAAAEGGVPAYFVAPDQEAVQPNHTSCDAEPYIRPLSAAGAYLAGAQDFAAPAATVVVPLEQGRKNEFAHPDADGYRAMADVLVSWSQGVEAPISAKRKAAGPAPAPAAAPVSDPVVTVLLDGRSPTTVDVRAGDAVRIEVRGMAPGATVTVEVHSAPRVLGSFPAGTDGTARGVVYVPPDLPAGAHTLVADGVGPGGAYRSYERPLRVRPPRPWWFWPAGTAVLLAAAGSLVLLRASRTPAPATS